MFAHRGIALRRWSRAGLVAAVSGLVGAIVVVGADDGNPAQDVRLRSGAAWLSSAKVGQVTLLDGSSAEVSAQVRIAPPGNLLDVVQQGSTAYAVDQTAGTIRRIDGATFDLTPPESPIPDAHAGLTALPGPDALYTLDNRRGVLADTDPRTLSRRGDLLPLAGELSVGTATVDEAGALWAIDTSTGDLARVAGGKRSTQQRVAAPGPSTLTIVDGHPVVVDTTARKAISIDRATGRPGATLDLDLREDDTVRISGSPHAERLYVVVGRGNLSICDVPAGECGNTIPLTAGNQFGAAVEAGDRLFIPDHTTGQVWVVDLADSRVLAKPTVLAPAGPFQLFTRDGIVFYNDPNSTQAGVIHLDGSLSKAVKYDPADPDKGVHTPDRGPSPPQQVPGDTQQPQQPNPQQPLPQQPNPSQPPQQPDPQRPPPQQPNPQPPDPQPPDPQSPDPRQRPDDPPQPEPRLEISVSNATPTAGQSVTLQVRDTTSAIPAGAQADWTFGDTATATGITTTHEWSAARESPYLVTVKVTFPDHRTATTSTNITVAAKPTFTLTAAVPGGGGTVSGGGIDCPPTCTAPVEAGTRVRLVAQPDAGHLPGTWSGACTGSTVSCDVTMDAAKSVAYTFGVPIQKVTLTAAAPNGGTIAGGGINCPGRCSVTVDKGTVINLAATPDQAHKFGGWGGACAGRGATCAVTMTADQNVSATFAAKAVFKLTVLVSSLGERPWEHGLITGPKGIACRASHATPPECTAQFYEGESVTLVAHPDPGYHFFEWDFDVPRSRNATITFVMDKAKTAMGTFEKN